jgi:hypothetical protein
VFADEAVHDPFNETVREVFVRQEPPKDEWPDELTEGYSQVEIGPEFATLDSIVQDLKRGRTVLVVDSDLER